MKAVFHWSGGKDSALALYALKSDPRYKDVEVVSLLTTVQATSERSSVHRIPRQLLEAQSLAIGLDLELLALPGVSLQGYREAIEGAARRLKKSGIDAFVFGDLSHSNVRQYKEEQFGPLGLKVIEPLWDYSSEQIVERFLASGLKARTVVVQADKLSKDYVGCELNREFFASLPTGVNPCGEYGEYHSFVYGGPLFKTTLEFKQSEPQWFEMSWPTTEGEKRWSYWVTSLE